MCGIVGYHGHRNPKDVLLSGLKTLEYRGYDSAGVAILHEGSFKRVRASGKLSELENKLVDEEFNGHLGIGHTRWATHGPPTEDNAHPHTVDGVTLVHNGIIENYLDIRKDLEALGVQCSSETDSELIAHLISLELKGKTETRDNFLQCVQNVIPKLKGAFSVVVAWESLPNVMIAFKNGPPLILGIGKDEIIVASDVQAVVPYTQQIVYLEDHEVLIVEEDKYDVFNYKGESVDRKPMFLEWSGDKAEKKGYPHFMLKEIYEQPRAVATCIDSFLNLDERVIELKDLGFGRDFHSFLSEDQTEAGLSLTQEILKNVERVFIVACGTSYYAGLTGEYLIEQWTGVPVEVEFASEFRYRKPVIPKNSLVIVISQSGETADTLAALRLANSQDVKTLSICNVQGSTIDRESKGHIYMKSGVEVGVASTKAFTSTLALLNILAFQIGSLKNKLSDEFKKKVVEDLIALPSQMEKVLAHKPFFEQAAETLKEFKGFLYIGRGFSYPIALEGALKLKELAYMHAEGYAAGEMKHGPIALIDNKMGVVVIAPDDELFEKTLSNLEEVRARGGQVISIGTGENDKLISLSKNYISIPKSGDSTSAILAVIPVQLMAYYVANALGHNVDQPRNLAKSVTVE